MLLLIVGATVYAGYAVAYPTLDTVMLTIVLAYPRNIEKNQQKFTKITIYNCFLYVNNDNC